MNIQDDMLTASIDDYLISLGDSLHKAQRQLSQMATAVQPGEAPITYHVPRLDFEFRISFELSKTGAPVSSSETPSAAPALFRIRPLSGSSNGTNASAEAASVIKGSFIAVPVRGGKPLPILRSRVRRLPGGLQLEISISLTTAAGDVLPGIDVQFNVDTELSAKMGMATGHAFQLEPGTGFVSGQVRSDANGVATNVLELDPAQKSGTTLMLIMDALGVSEKILYQLP